MRRFLSESELKSVFEAIDLDSSGKRKVTLIGNALSTTSADDCYTIKLSNASNPIERN
jgi:hypothetical protein